MAQNHYVFNYALLVGSLFALPCLAQTHDTSQTTTNAALKEVLKQYLKQKGVENDGSTRYIASFVDLNDDGKKEVIVYVIGQSFCGTGGCVTLVLVPQHSTFNIVAEITITRPPIRVLKVKSHGWHDLAVRVAGGGIRLGYEADLPFDGESYATNPTVPPAHKLSPRSAGRVVISDNAVDVPLD